MPHENLLRATDMARKKGLSFRFMAISEFLQFGFNKALLFDYENMTQIVFAVYSISCNKLVLKQQNGLPDVMMGW